MKNLTMRSQLIIIFTLIIIGFSAILFFGLDRYSRDLALNNASDKAELLLAHQRAVRSYTIENVRPLVRQVDSGDFHSEQIPAFAAQTVMANLNKSYPGYDYREAMLDPTNPKDLLEPWEKELLEGYRNGEFDSRQTRERLTDKGPVFSIAEPIVITNPACLTCHGVKEDAPPSMLQKFPGGGGFGWTLNTPLGIQSVTVPIEEAILSANKIREQLIGIIGLGLLVTLIALAFIVHIKVSGPVNQLSLAASKLSSGQPVTPDDFPDNSIEMTNIKLSIRRLVTSFNSKLRSKR